MDGSNRVGVNFIGCCSTSNITTKKSSRSLWRFHSLIQTFLPSEVKEWEKSETDIGKVRQRGDWGEL